MGGALLLGGAVVAASVPSVMHVSINQSINFSMIEAPALVCGRWRGCRCREQHRTYHTQSINHQQLSITITNNTLHTYITHIYIHTAIYHTHIYNIYTCAHRRYDPVLSSLAPGFPGCRAHISLYLATVARVSAHVQPAQAQRASRLPWLPCVWPVVSAPLHSECIVNTECIVRQQGGANSERNTGREIVSQLPTNPDR